MAVYLDRLQSELARPPFHAWLKPEPVAADADGVTIRLPVRPDMAGGTAPSFVHGGVIAALIDLTGYAAAACVTGRSAPTLALNIEYLRPTVTDYLVATGKVRHLGRKMVRVDIEIRAAEKTVALGRGTFVLQEDKS